MSTPPPPGWYCNPSGAPGQRYFDGQDWTPHHRAAPTPTQPPLAGMSTHALPQPAYLSAPPLPYANAAPPAVVVTGPNHVLHALLTLLTFWACGGWAWVWLIIALSDRRQVRIVAPPPPRR
ncbi:MAG: DUF2510 domain-containing protein [Mycobacterium sp.]|nr:DUF2510 domain-containing protein [Mycobacterium sp.]